MPRKELKFLLDRFEYTFLRQRLENTLERDRHSGENGCYLVSSLYYDSPRETAFTEKVGGVDDRKKYRIRIYNRDPAVIHLEVKGNRSGSVYKYTRPLTAEELARLSAGDDAFLLRDSSRAGLDLYANTRRVRLRPSLIVSYTRRAYIFPTDRVRINFDYDLYQHGADKDLIGSDSRIAFLTRHFILEIKYVTYLPSHIRDIVQLENKSRQSLSKFELARRRSY